MTTTFYVEKECLERHKEYLYPIRKLSVAEKTRSMMIPREDKKEYILKSLMNLQWLIKIIEFGEA